jgi:cell fate regulator YaaT (PSP1 superfamily)
MTIEDTTEYVEISFREAGELFLFEANGLILNIGDKVIVETEHGPALGDVKSLQSSDLLPPGHCKLYPVLRIANAEDLRRSVRNRQKEREAFDYCKERVEALGLDMKLIRAEYFFNGSKLLFYFASEDRVDFRELVRDLARYFQKRIEMRQIGVRDSAKLIGGIGTCGEMLCCHRFLRQFHPVSIRMIKDQNMPLNQQKVSGVCGRLMCCLAYEQGLYKELSKGLPKLGQELETPKGVGKVCELNPLQGKVSVLLTNDTTSYEEEFHISSLPQFPSVSIWDEPAPLRLDPGRRGKIRRKRGLEPLMEPRRLKQTPLPGGKSAHALPTVPSRSRRYDGAVSARTARVQAKRLASAEHASLDQSLESVAQDRNAPKEGKASDYERERAKKRTRYYSQQDLPSPPEKEHRSRKKPSLPSRSKANISAHPQSSSSSHPAHSPVTCSDCSHRCKGGTAPQTVHPDAKNAHSSDSKPHPQHTRRNRPNDSSPSVPAEMSKSAHKTHILPKSQTSTNEQANTKIPPDKLTHKPTSDNTQPQAHTKSPEKHSPSSKKKNRRRSKKKSQTKKRDD